MTAKTIKQTYLLLDADVVIETYTLGIWQTLIERCKVLLPSIVVHDEALFFQRDINGIPQEINLPMLVDADKVIEVAATTEEIIAFRALFDRVFIETLHDGEVEALALLNVGKVFGGLFCTGDARAIQALAMAGMSERGISLETLLKSIGLSRRLRKQFTGRFFKQNLVTGQMNRITGQGLAPRRLVDG